jgi:hypothetical protein
MIIGISDKCKRSAVAVLRRTKQNLGVRMKSQHSMDVQINLTKYNLHEDLCSLLNIKIHKEKLIELHSNAEINKKKKSQTVQSSEGKMEASLSQFNACRKKDSYHVCHRRSSCPCAGSKPPFHLHFLSLPSGCVIFHHTLSVLIPDYFLFSRFNSNPLDFLLLEKFFL